METKDWTFNHSWNWEVIEQISKQIPDIRVAIFPLALIVESVNLSDLLAFMISPQDSNSLWIPNLKGDKECYGLYWVVAPIHVIPHEQVVAWRELTANSE